MKWNKVVAINEGLLVRLEEEAASRGMELEAMIEGALIQWVAFIDAIDKLKEKRRNGA